ncbi:MAG: hypothetical protein AAFO03_22065, partial [Bacteroidota bacterium]
MLKQLSFLLSLLCLGLLAPQSSSAQTIEEDHFSSLEWRSIGPFRGGRSAAVCGVPGKPNLYYFGATGGG